MYISDAGKNPKIIKTELDGQNPTVIAETGYPTGVAVFGDSIYFSARNRNNGTWGEARIQKYYTEDGTLSSFDEIGSQYEVNMCHYREHFTIILGEFLILPYKHVLTLFITFFQVESNRAT